MQIPQGLADILLQRPATVILTGAGTSAESGIPTFREAQTGLWARFSPQELASPEGFAADPETVLNWYAWRRELIARAEPNAAHQAIVQLQRHLSRCALITQNVDGLHQRAGSGDVIELHGNISRQRCARGCSGLSDTLAGQAAAHPRCPQCNDYLRPDVVWFGETLPRTALQQAQENIFEAELVVVAGTSGLVYPAAALPRMAQQNGARVVEINPQTTELGESADWHLRDSASQVLSLLAAVF